MRLLALADHLRRWGLDVVEEPGWQDRGVHFAQKPLVAVGHHTATRQRPGVPFPTRRILINGRPDLPGPLCQVGLATDYRVHVIAAGKANHAGPGAWRGVERSSLTVGTEVEYAGTGPWDPQLLHTFDLVQAALLDMLGRSAGWYCGHREWALPAGRKVDPGNVDLDAQRLRIHALLHAGPPRPRPPIPAPRPEPDPVPAPEEDDMRAQAITADGVAWFAATADRCWHIRDQDELNAMRAAGTILEPVRTVTPQQLEILVRASR